MVALSRQHDFAFFSHWYTDYIGHRGPLADGISLLEMFDGVMRGALDVWNDDEGLMVITGDHGNFEALDHGKHTENPVPTVVIGSRRHEFATGFENLAQITPKILHLLGVET